MAEPKLAYTPAIGAALGAVHPTPEASPGALRLHEKRHDCIQLAGFGEGHELAAWLENTAGTAPPAGATRTVTILQEQAWLLAVAPATWLLLAEPGRLDRFLSRADDELQAIAAITDFSDGRSVAIELRGPAAVDILGMHLGMDLDETSFPCGACAATGFNAMQLVVVREKPDVFLVLVQRSFAVSLWETLLDSALGYGAIVE